MWFSNLYLQNIDQHLTDADCYFPVYYTEVEVLFSLFLFWSGTGAVESSPNSCRTRPHSNSTILVIFQTLIMGTCKLVPQKDVLKITLNHLCWWCEFLNTELGLVYMSRQQYHTGSYSSYCISGKTLLCSQAILWNVLVSEFLLTRSRCMSSDLIVL